MTTTIQFPRDDRGRRSTTNTGKAILTAAVQATDPSLADAIAREPDWRHNYHRYNRRLVELELAAGDNARAIARDGLNAAYDHFVATDDETQPPLRTLLTATPRFALHTVTIRGTAAPTMPAVPIEGQSLNHTHLAATMQQWLDAGTIEPSHRDAVLRAAARAATDGIPTTHGFALLGAGSEIGPLDALLAAGATVLAVDLPRPAVWRRLIETAHASAGTLLIPTRAPLPVDADSDAIAAVAGADLLTDAAEVAAWLSGFDGPLTVACHAYADSATHVRLSLAMDVVGERLRAARPDVSLAYLMTPTDVHGAPVAATAVAQARFAARGVVARVGGALTGQRVYAPNIRAVVSADGAPPFGLVDAQVIQQGPNYMLAKRLQRWRATDARANGTTVSCAITPPAWTASVTSNRLFKMAYRGAGAFGLTVFAPETLRPLMLYQLLDDLFNPNSIAQAAQPLPHPAILFADGANHGGLWRMPFQLRSILTLGIGRGALKTLTPFA